jgi:uncharacterized ferritin-like protein (DUF455 family)
MLIPRIVGIVQAQPSLSPPSAELRHRALRVLQVADPTEKCRATHQLVADWASGSLILDARATIRLPSDAALPGRPERPLLIDPADVPTRSPFTVEGRAALLHAVCHIEFNAINLALDAVWRFADMPEPFYADWLGVAAEEARHFELLHALLQQLQPQKNTGPGKAAPRNAQASEEPYWQYGSLDAHDGLWSMCEKTAHDVTARMALVPRTMEARGLDATPLIQNKLRQVAAQQKAPDALAICDALDVILHDEVGHVAIGNHWYGWLCMQQGLDPVAHYRQLAKAHAAPRLKPPFNDEARRRAGFTELELAYLLTAE